MTEFFKLSGAGNDFIVLAEPLRTPEPEAIRAWCRRGLSLGADGVVTLERTERGARMTHFNADGGRSELCLNGSRCAARLAFHLGWREDVLELVTDAGALTARAADGGRVGVELPPIVGRPEQIELALGGEGYAGFRLDVGVPHFVLPWDAGLGAAPVASLGPRLRRHPALMPRGANVSFVRFVARERFEIRTFERGVEAETLACGSAVVAAAVAGAAAGEVTTPVTARTSGGFELTVEADLDGPSPRGVVLVGDARIVARGELLDGAVASTSPPVWTR